MVAVYLLSAFEKSLLSTIGNADRSAPDYYLISPLLINCRDDAARFDAVVTATQRAWIVKDFASGRLKSVSGLTRPSYLYARAQLEERYALLSSDGIKTLDEFLIEWRREHRRRADQSGRQDEVASHAGIDIILPTGTRLPYDLINLRGL
jgi:hypothetical protein